MMLAELLDHAAQIIRDPINVGPRAFPPDMSRTLFREIADELAERSVKEFAARAPDVALSLADWERLRSAISSRIAMALYEMAFSEPPPIAAD